VASEEDKQKAKKERLEAWRRDRERKAASQAVTATEAPPASTSTGLTDQKATSDRGINAPAPTAIPVSHPLTTLKPTVFKAFSAAQQNASVRSGGPSQAPISAMDDGDEDAKHIERFTLPPMQELQPDPSDEEEEEDLGGGLVDDTDIHGKRDDIAATLKEKREAAAAAATAAASQPDVEMSVGTHDLTTVNAQMKATEDEEDEPDPLDAFMADVTKEVKQVNEQDLKRFGKGRDSALAEIVMADIEDTREGDDVGEGDELDKAEAQDILALAASKVKKRELAAVDHTKVDYEPFRKAFYHPPAEVEEMSEEDAERLRMEMDAIKVRGKDCPKPLTKWSYCGLPGTCLDVIKKLEYKAPTAVQAQAIPAIMSGRDIIGVAKTGSGKTMAFLLPMFRHIKDQRPVETNEGPIGLIMTPTRELAVQIYRESKPFLKAVGLRAVCVYGGAPISEQIAEMKKTCEIVVATPGRMLDLLMANSGRVTNLHRVTYLVLDEADRMFDMGFEPQVMKILNNVRPDRQTLLFSATFPKQMESLARKVLRNKPLEITVGGRSVVAPEIEQLVEVRSEASKFNRLLEILGKTYMDDEDCRTLIFVERQESADDLLKELMRKGYPTMSLHGGKDQVDRDSTITDFKAGIVPIVTATSVAARGLDVKQLKLVVNYDVPNHMEDYIHRAGRTGRAGNKGTCVTFITPEQDKYARDIIAALKASKVAIPAELQELADTFRDKVQSGKAQIAGSGFGGKGLERFESDREKALAAQRRAFGESTDDDGALQAAEKVDGALDDVKVHRSNVASTNEEMRQISEMQVEVKRGAAPQSIRDNKMRAEEEMDREKRDVVDTELIARNAKTIEAVKATGADTSKLAAALAKINAMTQERKLNRAKDDDEAARERQRKARDPDATDFHALIPINDFPQRARWRVTNKDTMSLLISETGASITLKGAFYEKGKEPQAGEAPKLQLLVESNDEAKVEGAVREIKQSLLEATQAALEAEQRGPGSAPGRYSIV
jgi:ATP-dependent RNA helicase DDX46/PRP5